MPKLRFTNGSQVEEIDLTPGTHRVGRSAANTIQLNDPSVSSSHCEIIVDTGTTTIRDLGSTNGTFVDHQPVSEGVLRPGQSLRLGSFEMVYEEPSRMRISLPTVAPPAIPEAPPDPAGEIATDLEPDSANCPNHPNVAGSLICKGCHKWFCPLCVNRRRVANRDMVFCRNCGEECVPVEKCFAEVQKQAETFYSKLPGAFAFPFKRDGVFLLIFGGILYLIFHFLGSFSWRIAALVGGYIAATMQKLVHHTAQGDDGPAGWPDVTEIWADVLRPFFLYLATGLVCFGPAIAAYFFLPEAAIPLLVFGFFYLPMGVLAVAMYDSLAALNPLLVILSICKVPLQYLVACAVLLMIVGVEWGINYLLETFLQVPFMPFIVSAPIAFYFLVVEMRILGLLYWTNKRRLGWFSW